MRTSSFCSCCVLLVAAFGWCDGFIAPGSLRQVSRLSAALPSEDDSVSLQRDRYRHLDKFNVLVLNADYQPLSFMPLSTWSWQDAIKAVWQGRVDVVDTYELVIRSASMTFELPSIVALKQFEKKEYKPIRFSKRLLSLRDEYRCQYCNKKSFDLTCDHVVPRSKGGETTWTNTVAACKECNTRKKNLSRDQLKSVGLALVREPYEPTPYQLEAIARRNFRLNRKVHRTKKIHNSWTSYL